MKKFILPLIACLTLTASTAFAATTVADDTGFFFKPYVGADYQYSSINNKTSVNGSGVSGDSVLANSLNGGDVHLGARVHENLGFEASYERSGNSVKGADVIGKGESTKTENSAFAFDALTYLPIDEAKKFELIGTAGLADDRGHVAYSGPMVQTSNNSVVDYRVGGGAQYWLTQNLNVRGLVRYEDRLNGTSSSEVKDIVVSSLGLNYQF